MASIEAGAEAKSWPQIVSGYRILTDVQHQFSGDCEMYKSIGNALFIGRQFSEAVIAFEIAERCDPGHPPRKLISVRLMPQRGGMKLPKSISSERLTWIP